MNNMRPTKTIAVTGGKGGVGKTSVAVNIALELVKNGNSVLLLDADLGMANVDIMLNLKPRFDLSHVIDGHCDLEDVIIKGPGGLHVVPAASGLGRMADLSSLEQAGLIRAFSYLESKYDVLVVDTAAGIASSVTSFTKAAQEIVVVVCDEPASLADAYGLIKVLSKEHAVKRFQILTNMVGTPEHGKALYSRLADVADLYLDVSLGYLGSIPMDDTMRSAVKSRAAVTDKYPYSAASLAFQKLAKRLLDLPITAGTNGQVEFFVERALASKNGDGMWERGIR
ncbi:MAG: MinD/ParA family protein [Gammaproteobacteria bacterium]|nr:MinD/ParA family protein [Gammaproteobacteria bacterium]